MSCEQNFEYDVVLKQGATFNFPVLIVDLVDGVEVPTVLTGWTAAMQARVTPNDTTPLFSLTTENGGISIDVNNGIINATIPGAITAAYLDHWRGVYDLKIFMPSGEVDRVIQGKLYVSPEVTR